VPVLTGVGRAVSAGRVDLTRKPGMGT